MLRAIAEVVEGVVHPTDVGPAITELCVLADIEFETQQDALERITALVKQGSISSEFFEERLSALYNLVPDEYAATEFDVSEARVRWQVLQKLAESIVREPVPDLRIMVWLSSLCETVVFGKASGDDVLHALGDDVLRALCWLNDFVTRALADNLDAAVLNQWGQTSGRVQNALTALRTQVERTFRSGDLEKAAYLSSCADAILTIVPEAELILADEDDALTLFHLLHTASCDAAHAQDLENYIEVGAAVEHLHRCVEEHQNCSYYPALDDLYDVVHNATALNWSTSQNRCEVIGQAIEDLGFQDTTQLLTVAAERSGEFLRTQTLDDLNEFSGLPESRRIACLSFVVDLIQLELQKKRWRVFSTEHCESRVDALRETLVQGIIADLPRSDLPILRDELARLRQEHAIPNAPIVDMTLRVLDNELTSRKRTREQSPIPANQIPAKRSRGRDPGSPGI